MDTQYPSIEEYKNFNKEKATETLELLIRDKQLVQWIVSEVGYDPTPKTYSQNTNWETTRLKEPEDSTKHAIRRDRGWQGTMPTTRHEAYVLDRILDRTQGYSKNVDRTEKFEHASTTLMRGWMCRGYHTKEYWNDKAKAIFRNNADAGSDVSSASAKSLNELTDLIKQEILSQDLKEETVSRWDFFYEKTFDKVVQPPKVSNDINWEEIADYFLFSASIPVGNKPLYYQAKYFS